jgi:tetratricopeptide (TPR) repeat protein
MAHVTDQLSDYLDDELPASERRAVEAHLAECGECARTLDELRDVVERAHRAVPQPPARDLWDGVASRLGEARRDARPFVQPRARRISFTVPQLAAAAVLVAAVSGGLVFLTARHPAAPAQAAAPARPAVHADAASSPAVDVTTVGFADAQYDQAVADLESALKHGRGRLDASTVAAIEQSLQTIDQAIAQARQALAADPANGYLSGHLVEARRRKLDLLRRAAALTETN